jgi:hypothetical protein
MKNLEPNSTAPAATTLPSTRETFSTTLHSGRVITAREMLGSHFIYMETALKKHSSMKKMFFMVAKLSEGTANPVALEEMESMAAKDIKKIAELFSRLAGEDPDEDDETSSEDEEIDFPN